MRERTTRDLANRSGKERSRWSRLMPPEHGAYALVLAPILVAMLRGATVAGLLLAVAIFAAFLAREPIMVLTGRRGGRAHRELGPFAGRLLVAYCVIVGVSGTFGIGLSTVPVIPAVMIAVVVAIATALIGFYSAEKSGLGTLVIAWGTAFAALPVAVANRWDLSYAIGTAIVFGISGAVSLFLAREMIPKRRREGGIAGYLAVTALLVGLVVFGAKAAGDQLPFHFAGALAPSALAGIVLLSLRPSPRRLRRVGWTLVLTTIVTASVLAAGPAFGAV